MPFLLAHLDIKHVALVSHSAGTIYLLNTLHHHRDILHPDQPFVALLGKLKILCISRYGLIPIFRDFYLHNASTMG